MKLALSTLALALCLSTVQAEDGFKPLFDGKTLKGWQRFGGVAEYHVEDGAIVGTTVRGTPNTFLTTKKMYGDFILELEFKVSPALNSGVQIRSLVKEQKKKNRPVFKRVYGYQVEIDPSARAWSGGIYDEGRRGWINNLQNNEPARKAFKQNGWNKYRVQCIGNSIKTWINGVPAADLVDSETLEGYIALQVHGYNPANVKKRYPDLDVPERAQVRWKNIRIKEIGKHKWKPFWNGKDLSEWRIQGGGEWKVVDGAIRGFNTRDQAAHGHLFLKTPVKDFTARIKYKAISGNSGFYFRTEETKGNVAIKGFQAEVDATRDAGGLYETNGRAWVSKPTPDQVKKFFKPGEWNQMTVSAKGRRITVHVNGRKSAELLNDKGRLEGLIALQLHGSQDMEVLFKDLEFLVKG